MNREDTFTYDKKKPMTPVQEKSSKPSTPINRQKPTIKQTLGSERKPLRLHSREIPGTPIFRGKPTVKNINECVAFQLLSSYLNDLDTIRIQVFSLSLFCSYTLIILSSLEADNKSNSGSIKGEQTTEVSEADLSVLYHQKLQMLYILVIRLSINTKSMKVPYAMLEIRNDFKSILGSVRTDSDSTYRRRHYPNL